MNGENQPINPFAERFAKTVESRIEADKIKNTHDNAVDLFQNSVDFFGQGNEEKKSEISTRIFSKFGRGYTNFESIVAATNDSSRNQNVALADLGSVVDSIYIVMNISALGSNLITDDLKNIEDIEDNLPEQMKGIGQKIIDKRLTDDAKNSIRAINQKIEDKKLFTTQNKVERGEIYKKWGEINATLLENSFIRQYAEVARTVLKGLGIVDVDESVKKVEIVGDDAKDAYYKDLAQYQKEKGILESEIKEHSLEELIRAFVKIAAPRERAPQLWEYEPPSWMGDVGKGENSSDKEKVREWRDILKFSEAYFAAVYNKRNDVAYKTSVEKVGDLILGMTTLEEKDLKWLYEQKALNVKKVAQTIMTDLFKEMVVSAEIEGKKQETTIYILKQKADGNYDGKAAIFQKDEVQYKEELAERLVTRGDFGNEEIAKLSIATVMNIMEIGGVFSLADTKRILGWESDAMRIIQRPETKYNAKLGKELWGGPWGNYLLTMSNGDQNRARQLAEELGIIPKLLAGSFLNQYLNKTDVLTIGDAFFQGKEIKFKESSNDLFYGWRKDQIKAGVDFYLYLSGKEPLEFKSFNETDNVINKWAGDFFNAIKDLRKSRTSLVTWQLIAGGIGGSTGLWPFGRPYLRFSRSGKEDAFAEYYKAGREILQLFKNVSPEEQKKIAEFYGVNQLYMKDFRSRLIDYDRAMSPYVSGKKREELLSKLMNK